MQDRLKEIIRRNGYLTDDEIAKVEAIQARIPEAVKLASPRAYNEMICYGREMYAKYPELLREVDEMNRKTGSVVGPMTLYDHPLMPRDEAMRGKALEEKHVAAGKKLDEAALKAARELGLDTAAGSNGIALHSWAATEKALNEIHCSLPNGIQEPLKNLQEPPGKGDDGPKQKAPEAAISGLGNTKTQPLKQPVTMPT